MLRWLFAAVHLLALGIGLGSIWARSRALRGSLDDAGVRRVLAADTWWGVAAALWLSTGLVRLLSSLEKGTGYYFHNHIFLGKMLLFVIIVALEIKPIITFVRWRSDLAKGTLPDTSRAPSLAGVSTLQAWLVVLMVLAATAMARGYGSIPSGD